MRSAIQAPSAIGAFIQNSDCHPAEDTNTPPTRGPRASATPAVPPQIPMALARARGSGKFSVNAAMDSGTTTAAHAPCSPRPAISTFIVGAMAHATDARPNAAVPPNRILRVPNRAPSNPPDKSKQANAKVYESKIHWAAVSPPPRRSVIVGIATGAILVSR